MVRGTCSSGPRAPARPTATAGDYLTATLPASMTAAREDTGGDSAGYIIPVGGAEEKIGDVAILRRFAALCGGESAGSPSSPQRPS